MNKPSHNMAHLASLTHDIMNVGQLSLVGQIEVKSMNKYGRNNA